jgi:hypothetical protein
MKVQVTGQAPTIYQLVSLKTLTSNNIKKNPDGSFVFNQKFDTKREAGQFLREQAHKIAYNAAELSDMLAEISKYGQLTYDAATIRVNRLTSKK